MYRVLFACPINKKIDYRKTDQIQMKKLYTLLFIILICSCSVRHENKAKTVELKRTETATPDFDVALKFINDYAEYCDQSMKHEAIDSNWIYNNELLTDSFKKRYKSVIDSAFVAEPELGLDADPIFDAQDYPDKGFEMIKTDKNGFVSVRGKDCTEFVVVLKVISQNGKWLVDGAGIINIPTDKRAKR